LQRDVEVVLESSNNNNFVGSVIHPQGNIAEALLKEGMAKCVDWSIAKVLFLDEGWGRSVIGPFVSSYQVKFHKGRILVL
jgi:hypothetical protein